jgi:hypothetical protein
VQQDDAPDRQQVHHDGQSHGSQPLPAVRPPAGPAVERVHNLRRRLQCMPLLDTETDHAHILAKFR